MSVYSNEIDLEILKQALEQNVDSLPDDVSQALLDALKAWQNQAPQAAEHLCELVIHSEALDRIYTQALTDLRRHYMAQERAKSCILTADSTQERNGLSHLVDDLTHTLEQFRWKTDAVKASETQKTILRALETHSLTLKDLTYRTGLSLSTLQPVVQTLRQRGDIDLLSAPLLHWIVPGLKPRRDRQPPIGEEEFLSLTLTGYFRLHPLIRLMNRGT